MHNQSMQSTSNQNVNAMMNSRGIGANTVNNNGMQSGAYRASATSNANQNAGGMMGSRNVGANTQNNNVNNRFAMPSSPNVNAQVNANTQSSQTGAYRNAGAYTQRGTNGYANASSVGGQGGSGSGTGRSMNNRNPYQNQNQRQQQMPNNMSHVGTEPVGDGSRGVGSINGVNGNRQGQSGGPGMYGRDRMQQQGSYRNTAGSDDFI